jgi:hypothetical protein
MPVRATRSKRVPVLIDAEIYEMFKRCPDVLDGKPVTRVINDALLAANKARPEVQELGEAHTI